jgi:hypothetical protein
LFYLADRSNSGIKTPGRIIIHDRNRVQTEVLPFYFNHASFASLRRQLSYFSFVRLGNLGRGRSTGSVTYINHSVYELSDILRLKRRTAGETPATAPVAAAAGMVSAIDTSERREEEYKRQERLMKLKGKQPKERVDLTKEVASAISSGKMHACETNHDLDEKYTMSMDTSKSLTAITLGTKSRAAKKSGKVKSTKKKQESAKYKKGSRKIRSRIQRLLKVNNVVPFIHLPLRRNKLKCLLQQLRRGMIEEADFQVLHAAFEKSKKSRKKKKKSSRSEKNGRSRGDKKKSKKARRTSRGNSSEENGQMETQASSSTSSSEEAVSSPTDSYLQSSRSGSDTNTSQSAASALLALGTGR